MNKDYKQLLTELIQQTDVLKTYQPNTMFSIVAGSHAYGLNHADSDVDFKGVFILPKIQYNQMDNRRVVSIDYLDQISDDKQNIVYFELAKFCKLLGKSNPNAIELLFSEKSLLDINNPVIDCLFSNKHNFISQGLIKAITAFAKTQIIKAKGLDKKVFNPQPERLKTPAEFCYILQGGKSLELIPWLTARKIDVNKTALTAIPNTSNLFNIYELETGKGICSDLSNQVKTSEIPTGLSSLGSVYYNKTGYSIHAKEHREYWSWVNLRNQSRFDKTMSLNKGYDSKNMGHCLRLLNQAEHLARYGEFIITAIDKPEIFAVKNGEHELEELLSLFETKTKTIDRLLQTSSLRTTPCLTVLDQLEKKIRNEFYS